MRYRSHHKRAEAHLDAAAGLLISAQENVQLAADHNEAARAAHLNAIDYHSERLSEVSDRAAEIREWRTNLGDFSG